MGAASRFRYWRLSHGFHAVLVFQAFPPGSVDFGPLPTDVVWPAGFDTASPARRRLPLNHGHKKLRQRDKWPVWRVPGLTPYEGSHCHEEEEVEK